MNKHFFTVRKEASTYKGYSDEDGIVYVIDSNGKEHTIPQNKMHYVDRDLIRTKAREIIEKLNL